MGQILEFIERSNANGAHMVAQVAARPAASLMSLQSSVHPFSTHRSYRQLMAGLSHEERVARMREWFQLGIGNDAWASPQRSVYEALDELDLVEAGVGEP